VLILGSRGDFTAQSGPNVRVVPGKNDVSQ
jgi:hypothetical protein